jgi:hypothetical protein
MPDLVLLTDFCWNLSRCTIQWQDYQKAREEVIELMNEAEKKLSEFSLLKTSSSHEAEEKLSEHKVSLIGVCFFQIAFDYCYNGSL